MSDEPKIIAMTHDEVIVEAPVRVEHGDVTPEYLARLRARGRDWWRRGAFHNTPAANFPVQSSLADVRPAQCNRPPAGWECSLRRDHEGPCPAREMTPAESSFFARRLERISPVMLEANFAELEPATMQQAYGNWLHDDHLERHGRYIKDMFQGNPGPDIRLGSRKIPRRVLAKIGHLYGRELRDPWLLRGGARNMHDVRRWLRQKFAPVAAVAGDALEQGERGRAMAILCEVVWVVDAIRIVDSVRQFATRDELLDSYVPRFVTGRASYGAPAPMLMPRAGLHREVISRTVLTPSEVHELIAQVAETVK